MKGLGIAAGAKRPGAKKAAAPAAPAAKAEAPAAPAAEQAEAEPKAEAQPEPKEQSDGNGAVEQPPVKGLGIARGARPPGKR